MTNRDTRPLPILTCPRPNRRAFSRDSYGVAHNHCDAARTSPQRETALGARNTCRRRPARLRRGDVARPWVQSRYDSRPGPRWARYGALRDHEGGQTQEPSQAVEVVRLLDYEVRTVIIGESKPQPERGAATAGRRKHRPRRNWSSSTSSPGQQGWQPRVLPEADEAGAVGDCACPARKARQRSVEIPAAFNASNGATAATSNGSSVSSTMPRFDRRP